MGYSSITKEQMAHLATKPKDGMIAAIEIKGYHEDLLARLKNEMHTNNTSQIMRDGLVELGKKILKDLPKNGQDEAKIDQK